MAEPVLENEAGVRFYVLLGAFAAIALAEAWWPRRQSAVAIGRRWYMNICLTISGSVLTNVVFPMMAVSVAVLASQQGWGLLNNVAIPHWLAFCLALLVLDMSRYWQHVALHATPLLWRLHRVHHSDPEYDCTTGLRFHPVEAVLTLGIQLAFIVGLGAPPAAVLLFELLFILAALFAHANVFLPQRLDRALRRVLTTPDLHRIHHSALTSEANSNYGGLLTWWDRLFGTYRDQPSMTHESMNIGLADVENASTLTFARLLVMPFSIPSVVREDKPRANSTLGALTPDQAREFVGGGDS